MLRFRFAGIRREWPPARCRRYRSAPLLSPVRTCPAHGPRARGAAARRIPTPAEGPASLRLSSGSPPWLLNDTPAQVSNAHQQRRRAAAKEGFVSRVRSSAAPRLCSRVLGDPGLTPRGYTISPLRGWSSRWLEQWPHDGGDGGQAPSPVASLMATVLVGGYNGCPLARPRAKLHPMSFVL